jgi:hypothetical protein
MPTPPGSPSVPSRLTLVTPGGAFGLRNVSPFCLKAEMLLTSLGLQFGMEVQPDPRKAPKGKLPYLIADEGVVPDSERLHDYTGRVQQHVGVFGR